MYSEIREETEVRVVNHLLKDGWVLVATHANLDSGDFEEGDYNVLYIMGRPR